MRFAAQEIYVGSQIAPRAGGARDVGLTAQPSFDADFAGDARDLIGERRQRRGHAVEGVGQRCHLALGLDGQSLPQVAAGHRGDHLDDAAHLVRQVVGHRIDVVREVLPGTGDPRHGGLAAELAVGADLAGDPGHLRRKAVQLIDHRVDGLFELQDLALDVDGDLAREVPAGNRRRDLGDVAHLAGQVARHRIDVVGEVLPGAGHAGHDRLTAQLALGADLARDACHLGREAVQLVDHRVDGLFELQDLATHVYGDLAREVTAGDRGGNLGDVAHLAGQVARHRVDVVRQVLPYATHVLDVGLTAELAVGAHLPRHARHLSGERVQLIDHRVDGLLELADLAAHVHRDLAREVAVGDRRRDLGDVAHLAREVARHRVDVVGQVLPDATHALDVGLSAQLAVGTDLASHARDLGGERIQLVDHRVDGFLELQDFAFDVDRDLARQVPSGDRRSHFRNVAHLARQVAGHRIDVVGEVLPGATRARYVGLAAELALGTHLARDTRHFRSERPQLVDHRVDGLLELQDLPADIDRDLAREVSVGDRGRDGGDVAYLARQVASHRVDVVGQVLPDATYVPDFGLTAELALGADLARHAGHFRSETVQLIDHRIDGLLELEDFPAHVHGNLAREVPARHRRGHFRDVAHLSGEIGRHRVDRVGQVLPRARHAGHDRLTPELALGAHLARHTRDFRSERPQLVDHRVHGLLELLDLAAHVHRDLARQVSARDRRGHFRNVAHLAGQIAGHGVHVVRQVPPRAGGAGD